jgi:hypothetical protein
MNKSPAVSILIVLGIAALLVGSFLPNGVRSQTVRAPVAVPIIPQVPVATGTTITAPRIERRIDPLPRFEPLPRTVAVPVSPSAATAAAAVTVIIPGRGPRAERETPDCSVHQFSCARTCDPLPSGFTSYRQCVGYQCKQVDESCLDKLAKELISRRADSEVVFSVESGYPDPIQIAFYSRERNTSWPGNNMAYNIADHGTHKYRLRCKSGEKICYGAWPRSSKYWGVGMNDRYGCRNCCGRCNGGSYSYVLGKE